MRPLPTQPTTPPCRANVHPTHQQPTTRHDPDRHPSPTPPPTQAGGPPRRRHLGTPRRRHSVVAAGPFRGPTPSDREDPIALPWPPSDFRRSQPGLPRSHNAMAPFRGPNGQHHWPLSLTKPLPAPPAPRSSDARHHDASARIAEASHRLPVPTAPHFPAQCHAAPRRYRAFPTFSWSSRATTPPLQPTAQERAGRQTYAYRPRRNCRRSAMTAPHPSPCHAPASDMLFPRRPVRRSSKP